MARRKRRKNRGRRKNRRSSRRRNPSILSPGRRKNANERLELMKQGLGAVVGYTLPGISNWIISKASPSIAAATTSSTIARAGTGVAITAAAAFAANKWGSRGQSSMTGKYGASVVLGSAIHTGVEIWNAIFQAMPKTGVIKKISQQAQDAAKTGSTATKANQNAQEVKGAAATPGAIWPKAIPSPAVKADPNAEPNNVDYVYASIGGDVSNPNEIALMNLNKGTWLGRDELVVGKGNTILMSDGATALVWSAPDSPADAKAELNAIYAKAGVTPGSLVTIGSVWKILSSMGIQKLQPLSSLSGYEEWSPSMGAYEEWSPSMGAYEEWSPSMGAYDAGYQVGAYEEWSPSMGAYAAGYQLSGNPWGEMF